MTMTRISLESRKKKKSTLHHGTNLRLSFSSSLEFANDIVRCNVSFNDTTLLLPPSFTSMGCTLVIQKKLPKLLAADGPKVVLQGRTKFPWSTCELEFTFLRT